MITRDILHYLRNPYGIGEERAREARLAAADLIEAPVDMILHCPQCHLQHIDAETSSTVESPIHAPVWGNPPHRSHLCHGCGFIWRPADVATNGVANIRTHGSKDSRRFDVD